MEHSAHGAEAGFYEHTAKPEADLEAAEERMEKSARKADALGQGPSPTAGEGETA